ncbi:SsrA-binding protein SmpB [Synoicihabitans lomoniglobus]|uniref:SsrA-binding protein n=1 Tax=Synoicihabitans lomoniglobus TaxID=2909285 RepID=A0AAF0I3Q7_9BACT|nr:SsrA-binding protein SmpB [Opitutaceae bacterium LMO-M01]WED66299.1 SsrA-binding protein SmpB [Opitutaceae bacterium LMO-M01]
MAAAQSHKKKAVRFTEIRNAKAMRDYFVETRFEAGIALKGTEVKSIRVGRAQINDAFGRLKNGELWLVNAHIDEYSFGSYSNHEPKRTRKLLLKKSELRKIDQAMNQGGRSLIPTRMYFKEALVKVEVAICTGKKLYDKREDLKKKIIDRETDRAVKAHR